VVERVGETVLPGPADQVEAVVGQAA
jgi:hypothetical protein